MGDSPSLDAWRAGVASLNYEDIPCPGISRRAWPDMLDGFTAFINEWGERALSLGWDTTGLFGVHYLAGDARVDSSGALINLRPVEIVAVEANIIRMRRGPASLIYPGMTNPRESVPIWSFIGDRISESFKQGHAHLAHATEAKVRRNRTAEAEHLHRAEQHRRECEELSGGRLTKLIR